MKPTKIAEKLQVCIKANRPAFIWGPPGVGKSDVIRQVASAMGYKLTDVRAVLLDPVDLRGIPSIENGIAKWCPPAFLPRGKGKHMLFLDELNAAPMLVQAACYQLVLDKKIGEYILPKDCVIVAAGNRETDRAVVSRMSTALKSRFIHLDFDTDLEDWVAWALEHGIKTEIIASLRFRPVLLNNFDPTRNDRAYACQRTWEFLSDVMKADENGLDYDLASGIVGEGAATEFMGFLKIYLGLPDPDVILMAPNKAEVPKDAATLYALCGALAAKAGEQTASRIMKYANRLPAEFSVLLVRDCIKKDANVVKTRAFIDWTSKHSEVLV